MWVLASADETRVRADPTCSSQWKGQSQSWFGCLLDPSKDSRVRLNEMAWYIMSDEAP